MSAIELRSDTVTRPDVHRADIERAADIIVRVLA